MDLSEVSKLDAPAKVLKLSTAMRIGAMIRPQGRGYWKHGVSCALQAAQEAITGNYDNMPATWAHRTFPEIPLDLLDYVALTLNDRDGMSRESIADYLESKGH